MGNTRTRGGHYFLKGTLLPGAALSAHPGPETGSQHPSFPHLPRAAQAEPVLEPPTPQPWERAACLLTVTAPLPGLQQSLSREIHYLCLQVTKGETVGQLSARHRPGLPRGQLAVTISCPCHQDQRLGLPGYTPHRPMVSLPPTCLQDGLATHTPAPSSTSTPVQTSGDKDSMQCALFQ